MDNIRLASDQFLKLYEAVNFYAAAAIKSIIYLNGVAAISLLTLLGHLFATQLDNYKNIIVSLIPSLGLYTYGAFLGGVTAGIAYLAQFYFAVGARVEFERTVSHNPNLLDNERSSADIVGTAFQIAGLIIGLFGLFSFLLATYYAKLAFQQI
ncbi:MAG: hypothetical protein EBQ96_07595 [Proteobacteria bacterium]|nr:hypothetical protein [Pseudomonadota bacterium]